MFTVGDIVRFIDVVDPGDAESRFTVIEDNGDRVYAELVCDWTIKPVRTLRREDLTLVQKGS